MFDEATLLRAADAFQRDTEWHMAAPPVQLGAVAIEEVAALSRQALNQHDFRLLLGAADQQRLAIGRPRNSLELDRSDKLRQFSQLTVGHAQEPDLGRGATRQIHHSDVLYRRETRPEPSAN